MVNSRFAKLSIRTQLIVLAVLLTLPALGLIVYSGLKERAGDYQDAVIESQRLADTLAAQQRMLTSEAELLCTLLTGLPEVMQHDVDKVRAILADIHKQSPQYINIMIADAKGHVWASAVPVDKTDSIDREAVFQKRPENPAVFVG